MKLPRGDCQYMQALIVRLRLGKFDSRSGVDEPQPNQAKQNVLPFGGSARDQTCVR